MPRLHLHRCPAVYALLALLMFTGCDGDEPTAEVGPDAAADASTDPDAGGPDPDAGVDPDPDAATEPEPAPIDPARVAEAEPLSVDAVPNAIPLGDGRVVAELATGLALFDVHGEHPLGDEPGALRDAASIGDDLLVAADAGLYALVEGELLPSPLGELVADVTRLLATGDGALWLIDAAGLHVWRDGELTGVTPQDMSSTDGPTTIGEWSDTATVWIADDASLYGVGYGDAGLQAWAVDADATIDAIAANDEGGVWLVVDGALWHLDPDGAWTPFELPFTINAIVGHPLAPDLWLDAAGALWQYREGRFRPVEGIPAYAGLRAEVDGSVLLYGPAGLHRVRPGRFLAVLGLNDGDLVDRDTTVTFEPTRPDLVDAVEYTLDGGDAVALDAAPYTLALSPVELAEGPHTLRVTAIYSDGERIDVELAFRIQGPPTWDDDIGPIYVEHCEQCHGERGGAHRMDTLEIWQDEFDDIVDAITNNRMPLPPNPAVPPAQLELIQSWGATGFLRSTP